MSGYDPRRVRPNPASQNSAPPADAASVDTLLGPALETEEHKKPNLAVVVDPAETIDSMPMPVRRIESKPSFWMQLSPLLVLMAALTLVWLIRRRKK